MATSRTQPIRRENLLPILGAAVFPVYSWSIIAVLYEIPAWRLYLSVWELISDIAYVQAFAMIESLLIWLSILAAAWILPAWMFRDRLVSQSTYVLTVTSLFAVALHYGDATIRLAGFAAVGEIALLWLLIIISGTVMIARSARVRGLLEGTAERLAVFVYVYIPISILCLLIVVGRNLLA